MVEKTQISDFWPQLYEPMRRWGGKIAEFLSPASEASLSDDSYRIAVELPGVNEDDIEVTCHEGTVTVKGEKKTEREEKGETWYFSERQFGAFSRSFRLPPDADSSALTAELKDGVLTLTAPKVTPAAPEVAKVKINKA